MAQTLKTQSPSEGPLIRRFASVEEMSRAAADFILAKARESVSARDRFKVCLSGGNTPRRLYEILSEAPYYLAMPWERTHIYFCDERVVPPDHDYSNFRMVEEALLAKIFIPPENIHRVQVESGAEEAALEYERELGAAPFDLVLLGMGRDGHTASLFPGDSAMSEQFRRVAAVKSSPTPPHVERVTLTLPTINAARCALFLVSGRDKAGIVEKIISTSRETEAYPATGVHTEEVVWMVSIR